MHRKDITESDTIHLSNTHKASNTSPNSPTLRTKPNFIKTLFGYLLRYQKGLLCLFVVLLGINQAESLSAKEVVLHAETKKTIKGTGPYFVLDDGYGNTWDMKTANELFGFSMPRQDGGEGREFIAGSKAVRFIKIRKGMKFKDVVAAVVADNKVHRLNATDGSVNVRVEDVDGDALSSSISTELRVYWQDAGGLIIRDLDSELKVDGCGYDLIVTYGGDGSGFTLSTRYGNPRDSSYYLPYDFGRKVQYKFVGDGVGKICAAYTGGIYLQTDLSKIKYRNGYNPDVYEVVVEGNNIRPVGFKVDSGFPTTGFKGATFIIKGSGFDQNKYRCSSSNRGRKISLYGKASSGQGWYCKVEYNSLTKEEFIAGGTPLIKMEYEESKGIWKEMGSYQIPIPKKWAIERGMARGKVAFGDKATLSESTKFPALDVCRGVPEGTTTREEALSPAFRQKYMYRRDEISNSPMADPIRYPEGGENGSSAGEVYESRDLGTFEGEFDLYVHPFSPSVTVYYRLYLLGETHWMDENRGSYIYGYNIGGRDNRNQHNFWLGLPYHIFYGNGSSWDVSTLCRGD